MFELDPITIAVLKGRLEQIADEMDASLFHSAFNPIIAEAHDACHGLYDAQTGDTLVQGKSGLPIFVGAMSFAVRAVIDRVKDGVELHPGDVFIFNDPYLGGTHLNDFRLIRPVFVDDELFCFIGSVGHWLDVGGNVPGNFNAAATEVFQEGFLCPPVKLVDDGHYRQDIVDILLANSRVPVSNYGDLQAQISALDLGSRRVQQLIDEYSRKTIEQAFAELSDRAEKLMRTAIRDVPDGIYRFEDFLDNDGIHDRPLRIELTLTVEADHMTVDFSGTDDACAGPLNIARSTTIAACYVAVKHIFTDVPANSGCLRPIEFVVPDGSLLSVDAPRPVGGYTETILRVIDVVFGAIAEALPENASGSPYATINALSLAGYRSNGKRWVMFCFFGGGLGGNPDGDGLNHGNNPISTATIPPVEILEAAYPMVFSRWALRPDSGGPGKHRGGLGAIYEIELLADSAEAFLLGERGKYPPFGVNGGHPAAMNRFFYPVDGKEVSPPMVSKVTSVALEQGQRVRIESPGGGGWGDPRTRDVELVARDVALGYISRQAAEDDYGVILKSDGRVDEDATEIARLALVALA